MPRRRPCWPYRPGAGQHVALRSPVSVSVLICAKPGERSHGGICLAISGSARLFFQGHHGHQVVIAGGLPHGVDQRALGGLYSNMLSSDCSWPASSVRSSMKTIVRGACRRQTVEVGFLGALALDAVEQGRLVIGSRGGRRLRRPAGPNGPSDDRRGRPTLSDCGCPARFAGGPFVRAWPGRARTEGF